MPIESLGGAKFFLLLKDDATGFRVIYFIKHKSEVPECIQHYVQMISTQTGVQVKIFMSDNGTEFINSTLADYFANMGIIHETSAPYCPESNGFIEREMRTLKDTARDMLNNVEEIFVSRISMG